LNRSPVQPLAGGSFSSTGIVLRQRGKLFGCGTAPVEISNLRSGRNRCFVWLFAFFIHSIHFSFSAKPFF